MDTTEIFIKLTEVVKDSLKPIEKWTKGLLYIKKLERSTGFDSSYIDELGKEIKIDTCVDYSTHKAVKQLYKKTQSSPMPHKNWNRAILLLYPNNKFEIEYIWDQELQDEVDGYNKGSKPIA